MNEENIYVSLTEVFRSVLMQDDLVLSPDLKAGQIEGWDSFKTIELIMAVEEHFEIKIPSQKLDKLESIDDFVKVIKMEKISCE